MKTYYEVLSIATNATEQQIKTAYRKLVKIHHPDKQGNKERFFEIQKAYEVLSDAVKKQAYDAQFGLGEGFHIRFTNVSPARGIRTVYTIYQDGKVDIHTE